MEIMTGEEIATEIKDGVYFIFIDEKPSVKTTSKGEARPLSDLCLKSQKRILDALITNYVFNLEIDIKRLSEVEIKGKKRPIQVLLTPEVAERLDDLNRLGADGEIVFLGKL